MMSMIQDVNEATAIVENVLKFQEGSTDNH